MSESSDPSLSKLLDVRNSLFELHKVLLDAQKASFEREHGRIASPAELLQLVIHNPQFDWLHRLSELMVEMDQATDARQPPTREIVEALLAQSRTLLTDQNTIFSWRLREALPVDARAAGVYAGIIGKLSL